MYNNLAAQNKTLPVSPLPTRSITAKFATQNNTDLYNIHSVFIENIGQYGETVQGYEAMGKILYGYEGMGMPFLFTTKGIIQLQRKIELAKSTGSRGEKDENEEPEEELKNAKVTDKAITMQWLNANPDPEIITEAKQTAYHTYGLIQKKAFGYKKIIYKEMYPGIDIIYSFIHGSKPGFEYSILVKPGADLGLVKMQFGGDIKNIRQATQTLLVSSDIEGISITNPLCFYEDDKTNKVSASFIVKGKELSFKTDNYDNKKSLVIDPFVSGTGNLTGVNAGIAKDIDYDYAGNVYVSGGGDFNIHQLAKFDATGVLQWTFSGSLIIPFWSFGMKYGGWTVEKASGNIYLGQGLGSQVIRLNTSGIYDNYIAVANALVEENWKMTWSCNGASSQIFLGGGGNSSNLTMGIISPPSTTVSFQNITGLPYPPTRGQDISDILIDPVTNDLYTIFANFSVIPFLNNRIYKHHYPYNPGDKVWDTTSGFNSLTEARNRPYLDINIGQNDNSTNTLAVNSNYLFYWDGKNLKAFNKNTGGIVNNAISYAGNTALFSGGIIADECDNVYIGFDNGIIKVLHFTASGGFDDSPPDISIPGFPAASVYDLAYDDAKHLLYACGSGFVASFDVSGYCASAIYSLSVITDCANGTATASINPATVFPISYSLYDGVTLISSNTTGIFNNLSGNIQYTIVATVNPFCSGPQAIANFRLDDLLSLSTGNSATICEGDQTILQAVSNAASYLWTPGATLNDSTILNPVASPVTTTKYYITASTGVCVKRDSVTVSVNPLPFINPGANPTICEGQKTILNAVSNGISFLWTPGSTLSNPAILNPEASPVVTTKYYLTASIGGCTQKDSVMVFVDPAPFAYAGRDTIICLGSDIQLSGSGGISYLWSPVTYLTNPNSSNPTAIKPPLGTIRYSLKVTDANGCQSLNNASVNITVKLLPRIFAGNDTAVAINQPTQLMALDINNSGFINYSWSPTYGLNNPAIANPVAILDRETTYIITAQTASGCESSDDIKIKVYKGPEIYVPGAFTPNGDGLNDILKAIPIGMKEFTLFSIYDRYGQMIFTTKNANTGWDGTMKGYRQDPAIFIWMAKAIDYKGNVVLRKGTVALIR